MHRSSFVLGTLIGIVGCASLAVVAERDAAACGGCFHTPPPPNQTTSDITDERMLLAVSPTQTTLYDQIDYSGNPSSFAWVLPIRGTVAVGLSADVLFDSVDALTATDVVAPVPDCPAAPTCNYGGALANGTTAEAPSAGGAGSGSGAGAVTVTKQQNVGPYATVQLSSASPQALETWLSTNGFEVPTAVQPVIAAYVTEGFGFLAMKLLPGQGISSMRPVRVSMPGAYLSLPLRMASIGTGSTVGITIWVVADGRYEPQNFPFFHIDDSALVWDWSTSSSNYTTLRAQDEAQYNGKGWELESSLSLNQQTISGVILSGGVISTGYGGGGSGVGGGPPPSDASEDYLPVTDSNGNVTETADQVRQDDITALFAGIAGPNARVTRMRSDISHAAMTTDFQLQASSDQTELSNVRNVTKSINLQCPVYGNDCSVIGYGTPAQAAAGVTATSGGSNPSTFACNTTPEPLGGPAGLGAGAALLGLVVVRMGRRRRG
jgi:hypothetical protein